MYDEEEFGEGTEEVDEDIGWFWGDIVWYVPCLAAE